jgi:hypothetical protein
MSQFYPLNRESVVSVDSEDECFFEGKTIILEDAVLAMTDKIDDDYQNWFNEGVAGKVMSPDQKGWITGKIRFTLEFEPDPSP